MCVDPWLGMYSSWPVHAFSARKKKAVAIRTEGCVNLLLSYTEGEMRDRGCKVYEDFYQNKAHKNKEVDVTC